MVGGFIFASCDGNRLRLKGSGCGNGICATNTGTVAF